MPTLTFTEGPDSYVSAAAVGDDLLILNFLGGNDWLRTTAYGTQAHMGDGDDYARIDATSGAAVYGEAGNDRIDIYARSSLADGGSGNDAFHIYGEGFYIRAFGGAGDDHFKFFSDMPFRGLEYFGGRHNFFLGGDGNDSFSAYGHDVGWVDGGAGSDRFYGLSWLTSESAGARGGPGDDLFRVEPVSPARFVENPGEGIDTVEVAYGATYVLPDNVENLVVLNFANAGGAGTVSGNALANRVTGGALGETLAGFAGDDKLFGLGGADVLDGGEGQDWLEGGAGRDELTGGGGSDRFIFRAGDFGGASAATADVIHDFNHAQGDRIRLDLIDANTSAGGDQAFAFIGSASFSHSPGELRYSESGGNTFIEGDTNGDGIADFMIRLDGALSLVGTDFIL